MSHVRTAHALVAASKVRSVSHGGGSLASRYPRSVLDFQATVMSRAQVWVQGYGRVLDIGTGDGGNALYFAERGCSRVIGLDPNIQPQCQVMGYGVAFVQAQGEAIPFPSRTFDFVFLKDVLHHVQDPRVVLFESLRVTRSGGHIVIIEPNRANPLFYVHLTLLQNHGHLSRRDFVSVVSSCAPSATFWSFEAHVYPWFGVHLTRVLRHVERWLTSVRVLEPIIGYQVAHIQVR